MSDDSWPPPFAVRVSARAKHARLRVLPLTGLEVVLPRGVDATTAMDIVERHKEWICKTLKRVCTDRAEPQTPLLPQDIVLHGGGTRLPVVYGQRANTPMPDRGALPEAVQVRAPESAPQAAAAALREWLCQYAHHTLGEEAAALAALHGLPFASLSFRRQKSRWGSCSSRKTLSLNVCLVFLPCELARHVLLHELAHTRHMNHGPGFWKTLFALEPDALALDRRLRTAWRYVPAWVWL